MKKRSSAPESGGNKGSVQLSVKGKNESPPGLPLKVGNEGFFSLVFEVTKMIPYGRITSYGAIARYLSTGRSARMVGWALNSSHTLPGFIPAHRVVNRNGMLTGKRHFGNSSTMKQLLENEGFTVEDDCVLDFNEKFWDPSTEL